MSHETPPPPPPQLFNMKMPKVKPIVELENSNFTCNAKQEPPTMNRCKWNNYLF